MVAGVALALDHKRAEHDGIFGGAGPSDFGHGRHGLGRGEVGAKGQEAREEGAVKRDFHGADTRKVRVRDEAKQRDKESGMRSKGSDVENQAEKTDELQGGASVGRPAMVSAGA